MTAILETIESARLRAENLQDTFCAVSYVGKGNVKRYAIIEESRIDCECLQEYNLTIHAIAEPGCVTTYTPGLDNNCKAFGING